MATILCISPNIALERTWVIPGLRLGGVFRVKEEVLLASGKALNAARAIRTLGGQPLAMGFLAGHTGRQVQALAEAEGLDGEYVWIEGETRVAAALVDDQPGAGDATLISERGPQTGEADWARLGEAAARHAPGAGAACLSGSVPPGTPPEAFIALVRRVQAAGCPVWVDSSGAGLQAGVRAGAAGIKANASEIGELLGMRIEDIERAREAAGKLRAMGAGSAVVTLGAGGAVMATGEGVWAAWPPRVKRVSTVGSGDVFLGGLLLGLVNGEGPDEALRKATAAGAANARTLGGGRFTREHFGEAFEQVRVERLA